MNSSHLAMLAIILCLLIAGRLIFKENMWLQHENHRLHHESASSQLAAEQLWQTINRAADAR